MKRPLIIVSGLKEREANEVLPILQNVKRPLYLEATSRLRGHDMLASFEVRSLRDLQFDAVIRIGNVPTLRYWRDLETNEVPVHNFSNIPLSGLSRSAKVSRLSELAGLLASPFEEWSELERKADKALAQKRIELIEKFPLSEPAWVNRLSQEIPNTARLFLGNSLPIREWDEFAEPQATRDVFANRGTNGIDGLISTFIGCAKEKGSNWSIIGDLSAMYDLSGPWALRQRPLEEFNLVILNNSGGQIFNRMFGNPMFINSHDVGFSHWAKMWGLDYLKLEKPTKLSGGRQVIEVIPSAEQTDEFWKAWVKV